MPLKDRSIKENGKKIIAGTVVAATVLGSGVAADALGSDDKIKYERENNIYSAASTEFANTNVFPLGERIEGVEEIQGQNAISTLFGIVFAPIWFVLKMILKITSPVWTPIVSAVAFIILAYLAIVAGLKIKYPKIPLKEILSKKNTALIFTMLILSYIAITLLPVVVPEIEKYIDLLKVLAGLVIYIITMIKIKVLRPKKVKYDIVFS